MLTTKVLPAMRSDLYTELYWDLDHHYFFSLPTAVTPAGSYFRGAAFAAAADGTHLASARSIAIRQDASGQDTPLGSVLGLGGMDLPNLKNLAEAAGQANQAGSAPEEQDSGAALETNSERLGSRRKRTARPTTGRQSDESPEVSSRYDSLA